MIVYAATEFWRKRNSLLGVLFSPMRIWSWAHFGGRKDTFEHKSTKTLLRALYKHITGLFVWRHRQKNMAISTIMLAAADFTTFLLRASIPLVAEAIHPYVEAEPIYRNNYINKRLSNCGMGYFLNPDTNRYPIQGCATAASPWLHLQCLLFRRESAGSPRSSGYRWAI